MHISVLKPTDPRSHEAVLGEQTEAHIPPGVKPSAERAQATMTTEHADWQVFDCKADVSLIAILAL